MGFKCKKSSLTVKHTKVSIFLPASLGSYLPHCCDTRNSAMSQAQIQGMIMTLIQMKKSDYKISTPLCLQHSVSFSSSFSQHGGLVQLMLTLVDICSNIHEVWYD